MAKNNNYKNNKKQQPQKKKKSALSKSDWLIIIAVVAVIALVVVLYILGEPKDNDIKTTSGGTNAGGETTEGKRLAADPIGTYYADIEIEGYGTISLELDGDTAPVTVANFVELAESGFYDGLTFHRIKSGFVMQGGCPEGNGYGDSGKEIVGEFVANGYDNDLPHYRGAISMARGEGYDSGSCQFFIVHQDNHQLNGLYAAFGYVTSGMDIVDAICNNAQPTDGNGTIPADQQPVIKTITIRK